MTQHFDYHPSACIHALPGTHTHTKEVFKRGIVISLVTCLQTAFDFVFVSDEASCGEREGQGADVCREAQGAADRS